MLPFLEESFGNPQSLHRDGQARPEAVDEARERVAALIGAGPGEIIFTASGTEANNLALKGLALAHRAKGTTSSSRPIEHPSVLNAAKSLGKIRLHRRRSSPSTGSAGWIRPPWQRPVRKETILVSVMLANSEVGDDRARRRDRRRSVQSPGVLVHTDAVAAAGNIPVDVRALGVDALSLAGDSFFGPKGSAALFLKKGTRLLPLIDGGIQEGGRRGGTENVAGDRRPGRSGRPAAAGMCRARRPDGRPPRPADRRASPGRPACPSHRDPRRAGCRIMPASCVRFVEGEAMLLSLDMKGSRPRAARPAPRNRSRPRTSSWPWASTTPLAQGSLVFSLIDDDDGRRHRLS